jgi:hypothetical protein
LLMRSIVLNLNKRNANRILSSRQRHAVQAINAHEIRHTEVSIMSGNGVLSKRSATLWATSPFTHVAETVYQHMIPTIRGCATIMNDVA